MQCRAASESVADVRDSADTASLSSLPPVVQDFHESSIHHTAIRHQQRTSLEMPTNAAFAYSINPNSDGTKAKSYCRVRGTAVLNRAAASHAVLRRRH